MARPDGRRPGELRPLSLEIDFQKHAEGSVLLRAGLTWVLCSASVEEKVPSFVSPLGAGWVTAEYAMLPRSTHTRSGRSPGGRGQEIQRLVGRALRGATDRLALGPRTITVDCDVLSADGGTRTASITGGWIALALAVKRLQAGGKLAAPALGEPLAAVSVGLVDGEPRLDLAYEEDAHADVDMNVVMTESGRLVEIQGTAEGRSFSRAELDALLGLAEKGIKELVARQRAIVGTMLA